MLIVVAHSKLSTMTIGNERENLVDGTFEGNACPQHKGDGHRQDLREWRDVNQHLRCREQRQDEDIDQCDDGIPTSNG